MLCEQILGKLPDFDLSGKLSNMSILNGTRPSKNT